MTTVYSEHLVAQVLAFVDARYPTGAALDAARGRISVTLGKVLGPLVGSRPSDEGLAWWVGTWGTPAPVGTRGAVHVLGDGRCALGLGAGRGAVEGAGGRLAVVTAPEGGRYPQAWRLPGVLYGGLL